MTDPPRLDAAGEWTGHWWVPAEPDRKVAGVLRYDPDEGLRLSLIGGFEDRILREFGDGGIAVMEGTRSWPVIWGVAENRLITLFDCLPISSKSYGVACDGPQKLAVSAMTALVGVHLEGRADEVFTSSLVSVENLKRWAASSVFTATIGMKDKRFDGHGTITVEPADEPSVVVDGTTITLAHEYTLPYFE